LSQSGVSKPTIARLESADGDLGGYADTRERMVSAISNAGIEFIPENSGGAGVRMRKRRRKPPPLIGSPDEVKGG
jgi:hypothetical protein